MLKELKELQRELKARLDLKVLKVLKALKEVLLGLQVR